MGEAVEIGHDLQRVYAEREHAMWYVSETDQRVSHWSQHRERVADFDAAYRGDLLTIDPEGSDRMEKPKTPNIIQLAVEAHSSSAASAPLSYRCDYRDERGAARAEKREQIVYYYEEINNMALQRYRYYMDQAATGVSYKLILPDFKSKSPCIKRLDPRHTLPDRLWAPDTPINSVVVKQALPLTDIQREYPNTEWPSGMVMSQLVDVYRWYDSSEWVSVAMVSVKTRNARGVEVLENYGVFLGPRISNKLGKCNVVAAARPAADGQPRGLYDQAIGIFVAQNRQKSLLMDYAMDWVASDKLAWNVQNPEHIGTGQVLLANGADAFVRRQVPEEANPQVFALMQQNADDLRTSAVHPRGIEGTAPASQASAAAINALQGGWNAVVATAQTIEATSDAVSMSLALEIDDKYFGDERKFIIGAANGKKFNLSYVPKEDIAGDYRVRATYGAASGQDVMTYEIRLTQQVLNGLLPKRIARENLSSIRDVMEAEKLIMKEELLTAGMIYIKQMASNPNGPNFAPAAALLKAIDSDEETILSVLTSFENIIAPQPATQTGATGTEAFNQAGALARGGIQPANVPGVSQLPDLGEVLVQ